MKKDKSTQPVLMQVFVWIWRLFASIKLAVFLIMALAVLGLLGTFVAPVIFFYTIWFWLPSMLLMLNILICSINRWKSIRTVIQGGPIRHPVPFYQVQNDQTEFFDLSQARDQVEPTLIQSLKQMRYRVRREDSGDVLYLAADKNRWFKLGTYVSHLSLILFVLAALIGGLYGFRENSFIVLEGETREIGHDTGLAIHLVSFTDEYHADGTPSDYRSDIQVKLGDHDVAQHLLRVNHPLYIQGIRVYQSFFGPAIQIQLKQNNQVTDFKVALSDVSQGPDFRRYTGLLEPVDSAIVYRFLSPTGNGNDPMIPSGQIALEIYEKGEVISRHLLIQGKPVTTSDVELTYQKDIQYSGLQISHDPTNFLIWIAAALFLLGTTSVLFFPWRQLWIMVQPLKSGQNRLYVHWGSARSSIGDEDPAKIRQILKRLVGLTSTDQNGLGAANKPTGMKA